MLPQYAFHARRFAQKLQKNLVFSLVRKPAQIISYRRQLRQLLYKVFPLFFPENFELFPLSFPCRITFFPEALFTLKKL